MTPTEFRAALAEIGLSQAAFARWADVNPRTVRRWLSGKTAIPAHGGLLLDLAARYGRRLSRTKIPKNRPNFFKDGRV
jgi:DNA-binding transcriptional regulator YiaG